MYIDTSVLVPYYCPEALSRAAERTLRGDPRPAVSDLVEVEFFSALARKVRVREMSAADASRSSGNTTRPPAGGWPGSRCRCGRWMRFISPLPTWRGSVWQPLTRICPGVRGVSESRSRSFGPEG